MDKMWELQSVNTVYVWQWEVNGSEDILRDQCVLYISDCTVSDLFIEMMTAEYFVGVL